MHSWKIKWGKVCQVTSLVKEVERTRNKASRSLFQPNKWSRCTDGLSPEGSTGMICDFEAWNKGASEKITPRTKINEKSKWTAQKTMCELKGLPLMRTG